MTNETLTKKLSRWIRLGKKLTFVMFVATAFSTFTTAFAQSSASSNRQIVFIHGFNIFGLPEDCKSDWSKMEAGLVASGFKGPMTTIGWYGNDVNCDVITSKNGTIMSKTIDITRDLAWYLYNNYSQYGTPVDVVAHSFGGLLTRYALYRVAISDPSFPPFLNIAHATTVGSPYEGYSTIAELCHVVIVNQECYDMFPLSSFIKELNSPAASLPQGVNGTIWANAGSNADPIDDSDGFVTSDSATSMQIASQRKLILPWNKFIFHTMYAHDDEVISWVASMLRDASAAQVAANVNTALPAVSDSANVFVSQAHLVQDVTRLPASQKPAHIAPFYVNGVQQGVQFTQVLAGGMFDEMGIQENDVVQGCTPETINQPSFPVEGIRKNGKGKMKFCIVRNGQKLTQVVSAQ